METSQLYAVEKNTWEASMNITTALVESDPKTLPLKGARV